MQEAVKSQIQLRGADWREGEVILCNHPALGGSHLPDLTVITPIWSDVTPSLVAAINHHFTLSPDSPPHPPHSSQSPTAPHAPEKSDTYRRPIFYVASRGHHSDIGGLTPGSMPPHSTSLSEEGCAIRSFVLVSELSCFDSLGCDVLFGGTDQDEDVVRRALRFNNCPASPPSRRLGDVVSDLKAQVAANHRGSLLLRRLTDERGVEEVITYMSYLQLASERAVREMLVATAVRLSEKSEVSSEVSEVREVSEVSEVREGSEVNEVREVSEVVIRGEDYMDDGSRIRLEVRIDKLKGSAVFDFTGSGPEVLGNLNCPLPVTKSAVIYSLRCLVKQSIPLNQGCMNPVRVVTEKGSVLDPSEDAAVVAGNVLTSQRIVDVILHIFSAVADSYGCMNNLTFGNDKSAFYETIGGGCGAGNGWNGRSGVQCHMTNTRVTDAEVIERRYPVLVRAFGLRRRSGGEGKWRGGDGIVRELEFLKDGIEVNLLTERRVLSPRGLSGGECGVRGRNLWMKCEEREKGAVAGFAQGPLGALLGMEVDGERKGEESQAIDVRESVWGGAESVGYHIINVGGKCTFRVSANDRVRVETPGGGGWGERGG
eukprot:GHVN01004213.1.p1 GENE.GHVN01004213.1~~GHVN01004213.1.p1  ORF type:complete len:694 (+),score=249.63 GHVN01004213.1:291-2084(+)